MVAASEQESGAKDHLRTWHVLVRWLGEGGGGGGGWWDTQAAGIEADHGYGSQIIDEGKW